MINNVSLEEIKEEYELNIPTSILDAIQIEKSEKDILREDPFFLMIAVLSDQSVKSEIAWRLPYALMERIGQDNLNPYWVVSNEHLIYEAIKNKPALHRFPQKIADFIVSMSQTVIQEYNGSASRMLLKTKDYNDFTKQIKMLKGISEKKANLMFLILTLDFNIPFSNTQDSKALLDVHIKRYLERILGSTVTQKQADKWFKEIDPENPARVSPFLWNKLRHAPKVKDETIDA